MPDAAEAETRQNTVGPRRRRCRFGLRGLLAALALASGVCYAGAHAEAWRRESETVVDEYQLIRAAEGPLVGGDAFRDRRYLIANVPCRVVREGGETRVAYEPVTQEDVARRNSGEVWVAPPGRWVTRPSQAIRLLVNHL